MRNKLYAETECTYPRVGCQCCHLTLLMRWVEYPQGERGWCVAVAAGRLSIFITKMKPALQEVVAQFAEREIAAIPFTIPSFSLFKWDETAIAEKKD